MDAFLYVVGAALIAAGLVGAVLPAVPGIPLLFGGIWLIAGADHYHHLGLWWLLGIASVGTVGIVFDLLASALSAKRVGASHLALAGALVGTLIGLFFGLPGVLIGPFAGALFGELAAGNSVQRSTQVGVSTWVGLIFGTIVKLAACVTMITLTGFGWWWNR
jgi:uncharacterized protein